MALRPEHRFLSSGLVQFQDACINALSFRTTCDHMLLGVPFLLFSLCIPCMLTQLSNGVCIVPGVELSYSMASACSIYFLRSLGKSARSYISHDRLFNSVAALTFLSRHRDAGNLFTQRFIDIPQQISGEFQHERLVEKWQVRD